MRNMTTLLEQAPEIRAIADKIKKLQQLNRYLSNLLPDYLANNCAVANFRDGVVVLVTNSPTWKNQLSLMRMDLLAKLRSNPNWAGVSSITVTIDYLMEDLSRQINQPLAHDGLSQDLSICSNDKTSNAEQSEKSEQLGRKYKLSAQLASAVKDSIKNDISHQPLLQQLNKLIDKLTVVDK